MNGNTGEVGSAPALETPEQHGTSHRAPDAAVGSAKSVSAILGRAADRIEAKGAFVRTYSAEHPNPRKPVEIINCLPTEEDAVAWSAMGAIWAELRRLPKAAVTAAHNYFKAHVSPDHALFLWCCAQTQESSVQALRQAAALAKAEGR